MLLFSLPLSTTPCPTFSQYFLSLYAITFACIFPYFCSHFLCLPFFLLFSTLFSCFFSCFCCHFLCLAAMSYIFFKCSLVVRHFPCVFPYFCSHFLCLPYFCSHFLCLPSHLLHFLHFLLHLLAVFSNHNSGPKKKGGQNAHFLSISYLEIETIKKWTQLYNCLEHFSNTPADYTELLQLNI